MIKYVFDHRVYDFEDDPIKENYWVDVATIIISSIAGGNDHTIDNNNIKEQYTFLKKRLKPAEKEKILDLILGCLRVIPPVPFSIIEKHVESFIPNLKTEKDELFIMDAFTDGSFEEGSLKKGKGCSDCPMNDDCVNYSKSNKKNACSNAAPAAQ